MDRSPPYLKRRQVIAGLAMAGLTLSGCGQNAAPVDDQGRVRLRLVLDDAPGALHGGYFQALVSGHYQRRNLNVEILAGGGEVSASELLASGSVELAVGADGFSVLSLLGAGAPVRAVAAYLQKDTHALISHAAAPIETPADLEDRTVVVGAADAASAWPLWAGLNALDASARMTPPPGDELDAFLADPQAVLLTDLRQGPPDVRPEIQTVVLGDQNYPVYGGLLLAPNGFARDNATALRAFVIATAEGWRDYLNGDPAEAHARLQEANEAVTPETLAAVRDLLIAHQMVQGGEAAIRGIGVMNPDRWRAFIDAAIEAGLSPPGLDARDAFTLDYLPGRG